MSGINVIERPVFQPDRMAVARRFTDAACRKKVLAELERYDRLTALQKDLQLLRKAPAAAEALAAEGVAIPEAMAEAAIDKWVERDRGLMDEHVGAVIVGQLSDRVAPELRRCLRAAAESVRADIAALEAVEDRIAKTYGARRIKTDLRCALEALEQSLDEQADGKIDFSWHYLPRVALSDWFSKPL